MPPPPQLSLSTALAHPWRWEENHSVLVWEDGTTLGFLDEIEAISQKTTQQRLPSLPCVALILAGCRGRSPTFNPVSANRTPMVLLDEAGAILRGLQKFPSDLLMIAGKAAIIEMVAGAERMTTYFVRDAIDAWRDHAEAQADGHEEPLARTLMRVAKALRQITPDAVRARLATGLDDVVRTAEVPDLELTESVRRLLALLKDDAELSGIAALARDLLAALTFPRRPDEDAEVPEGGFSDLTNRGSPDRLLLSELAADPLMLAVRVSLNEALYLRRETPRRSKPRAVAVLVDTGLRMWGLPRPFAWAVALALLAKQEDMAELSLWCVDGASVSRLRLASRDDLLAALSRLDPGADPVPALGRFLQAATEWQQQKEAPADTDFFFITHPDTLLDPAFWRQTDGWPTLHLALVDQVGQFLLEQRARSARRELARARLKLDSILSAPAARTASRGPREPIILLQHPFPLRVAARGRVLATCAAGGNGWCAVTEPRQWVYWMNGWLGGVLLAHHLPRGRVVWMDFVAPFSSCALFQEDKGDLMLVRSDQAGVAEFTLDFGAAALHAHRIGGALLVVSTTSLAAYSLENGRRLSLQPDAFHLGNPTFCGRFFRNIFIWNTLTWDGSRASVARLLWPGGDDIVLAFATPEGAPCALYKNGSIVSYATEPPSVITSLDCPEPTRQVVSAELSGDGNRLVAKFQNGLLMGWIFSEKRKVPMSAWSSDTWLLNSPPPGSTSFVNVTRVAFTAFSELAIQLNGKQWLRLMQEEDGNLLWRTPLHGEKFEDSIDVKRPEQGSRAWRGVATWPSGARLFVDHHGILHLLSPSADGLQIALTTGNGRVGIWTTDGCHGPSEMLTSTLASPAWGDLARMALYRFQRAATGR
jgi:hypothetical protein